MALTIFLIGLAVTVIVLGIGAYHALKCDMICRAYELMPDLLTSEIRHEEALYIDLSQRGVTLTASDFRKFIRKLIETNRIEVVSEIAPEEPTSHRTFTPPGNWYRLYKKPGTRKSLSAETAPQHPSRKSIWVLLDELEEMGTLNPSDSSAKS